MSQQYLAKVEVVDLSSQQSIGLIMSYISPEFALVEMLPIGGQIKTMIYDYQLNEAQPNAVY